jgi:AcrR family transcriptional regulator
VTEPTIVSRPHRARRGEGDRLREDIVAAAETLLVEKGSMDDVSMRAIATRVGVTPPSIYLHFDDKVDLFFAVCERRFGEFAAAITEVLDHTADPAEQLTALARAYVRWGLDNPQHYEVLFGTSITLPDGVDPLQLAGSKAFDAAVAAIAAGTAAGTFRDVDPRAAAVALWSMMHGFVEVATSEAGFLPDVDLLSCVDVVIETGIRGLARAPERD